MFQNKLRTHFCCPGNRGIIEIEVVKTKLRFLFPQFWILEIRLYVTNMNETEL